MKSLYVLILLFLSPFSLYGMNIKSMISGMGATFGAPPTGYTYSFEVFNDASVPVHVELEGMASFMGACFPSAKGYYNNQTLPSIFDIAGAISKGVYHNQNYYFKMYISDHSSPHTNPIYKQSLTQLPLAKNDPNIYYYHVYTGTDFVKGARQHVPKVESMGFQNPSAQPNAPASTQGNVTFSSQLSALMFYNSSGTDVKISLTYGPAPYTFTAEKYSFNALAIPTPQAPPANSSSSTTSVTTSKEASKNSKAPVAAATPAPLFSLRPNTISFASYDTATQKYVSFKTLMLPSQGFDGSTYTIEIFQDQGQPLNVGIQGLTPGNYAVPVSSRVRDVTPCPSTFWYQSLEQASSGQGYVDLPGQVWVVYPGIDNPICSKVMPGQVVSWNLTRPSLGQQDQFVYFVYVVTSDDVKAQQFVTNLSQQKLGQTVINEYVQAAQKTFMMPSVTQAQQGLGTGGAVAQVTQALTADQQLQTLMGSLAIANGVIQDQSSGLIGYILGTDIFTPTGLGFGRFYYVLAPSVINFDSLVSIVSGFLDSSKSSSLGANLTTVLTKQVNSWFAAYLKNPATVQEQIQKFLIQYGNAQLVKGAALTLSGTAALQTIISGNISLQYPSMKLSTVTNQYVYDFGNAAPAKMPTTIIPLPQGPPEPSTQSSAKTTAQPVKVVPKSTLMKKSATNKALQRFGQGSQAALGTGAGVGTALLTGVAAVAIGATTDAVAQ